MPQSEDWKYPNVVDTMFRRASVTPGKPWRFSQGRAHMALGVEGGRHTSSAPDPTPSLVQSLPLFRYLPGKQRQRVQTHAGQRELQLFGGGVLVGDYDTQPATFPRCHES